MIAATRRRTRDPAASNSSERVPDTWPNVSDSLVSVVAACQRGDRAAQRTLYDHCNARVFRLAVRMVGVQDASDLTQQVFLRVYHTIHQFTGRSCVKTWLYRLTVNECLQFLRYSKRRWHESLDYDPAARSIATNREIQARELLEIALQRLDPDLRAVFLLREVEGLDYGQLATTLEISEGTVASRLNRARSKLKEHLLDLGWEI